MARETQQLIANTFYDKVCASSLAATRITDIIDELHITRSAFYYYFANKYEVALWIFQNDIAQGLLDTFSEEELVRLPAKTGSKKQGLPYYVHIETGAHLLDISEFLRVLVRTLSRKPVFYRKLFNAHEVEFRRCVFEEYLQAMKDDVDFVLDIRYLPEETKDSLAHAGTHHIIALIDYSLEHGSKSILDERINPFLNFFHDSLSSEIMNHPVSRYASR